jgi:hypothetical protein
LGFRRFWSWISVEIAWPFWNSISFLSPSSEWKRWYYFAWVMRV